VTETNLEQKYVVDKY